MRLLCRVNRWTAALLQLSSSCDSAFTGVPAWMVALVCAASLCLVCELERGRPHGGGRLWPLLLRLEAHAPRLLLRLYCAAFILAANMLLLGEPLSLVGMLVC